MSSFLYISADRVGEESGGGSVTAHEYKALKRLGETHLISRNIYAFPEKPFEQDLFILGVIKSNIQRRNFKDIKLAHIYSGCASETVKYLKEQGVKVTYTCAAHDKDISQREHERLGAPYPYPHLTDPELWNKYKEGYLLADRLIVPSKHSQECMRRYGRVGEIDIISHGVDVPDFVPPFPHDFTVGYLGAVGPDKGVIYLLQAWKKLNYDDAVLFLAGTHSTSSTVKTACERLGLKNYFLAGWVPSVSYFYSSITLYCQPSVSEGFGLEIIESMAYGRPVVCSTGAGAVDFVSNYHHFSPGNIDEMCDRIDKFKTGFFDVKDFGNQGREFVKEAAQWCDIENRYEEVWRGLL